MVQPSRESPVCVSALDEAEALGNAVIGLMTRLEHAIAAAAKGDFPNLIHSDGCVPRNDRLLGMIADIEDRIIRNMRAADSVGLDISVFEDTVRLSHEYLRRELEVLRPMSYPGRRYYEVAGPLLTRLYEARLTYLVELEKQLHESSVIISKFPDPIEVATTPS